MEQPRQGQASLTEEINKIFDIANNINDVIYSIDSHAPSVYGADRIPADVREAQRGLEQLYYSIIRSEEKKLPEGAAEIIENAIKVFEEDLSFFERKLGEGAAVSDPRIKQILTNYYQRSIESLTTILTGLKRVKELISSLLEEKQQSPTEEKEEVTPKTEQATAEKKAPTRAESTPPEKKQPPAERKAPTLSNLAAAVDAFVKLITILNDLVGKAPTGSKDSLSYWNFLKERYLKRDNEIKELIERIRQVYPDLVFEAKNAANFLIEVHRRLKEDIRKWNEWATQQQPLAKADPRFIALIALPQLKMMLESIPEEAISRAGILLQAAEQALSQYQTALEGMTPDQVEQKIKTERLQAGKKLLEGLKPLENVPKPQPKKVDVSGFRLISSEEGRRLARRVFSSLSGAEILPEEKPTPRMIYLEVFHEMLETLHDFLWKLFPFGKEYKSLEEITEEDFGPLKGAGMEWRNKAIGLRKVLSQYLKYYRRRPRKNIDEDLKEIGDKLLESLKAFIKVSNNLVAEYSKLRQQYAKLSEEEKRAFSNLPNFAALLYAEDGIPLLQDLINKISRWKQALETSQQLLRTLLPQGDREHQQWLIEEKHTL